MLLVAVTLCGFPAMTGAADWNEEHQALVVRAAGGDAWAQTQLAIQYEHGEGVAKDLSKALRYYCLAAEQGYTKAEYNLGWMYANGRGVTRDDAIAATWFERAAKRGDPYAARMLRRLGAGPGSIEAVCPGSAAPSRSPSGPPPQREQIEAWVRELAPQYELRPRLVLAVVTVESLFDPKARSGKNAQGLMQLIPATAERFGVKNSWDPIQNLKGGMAYLREKRSGCPAACGGGE
jgi:soluble lytic murein transglycosylase-like protein